MMAFWGFFGGVNVPLPGWAYTVFNTTAALAVGGLIVAAVRRALRGLNRAADASMVWARCFAAIWPVVIFLSLLSWTRQTWASQGRLWFSAIAALSVWMAVGLAEWTRREAVRRGVLTIAAAVFVALAVYAPVFVIRPAYSLDRTARFAGKRTSAPVAPRHAGPSQRIRARSFARRGSQLAARSSRATTCALHRPSTSPAT